jgi:fructuronate reductase
MAHLGVGAFHRCHQAEFTDDALEAEFGPWGVVGINLRPPALGDMLGAQDGLYSRALREENDATVRVIGCIRATIDAEATPEPALAALASPNIAIATLTVTEKGYCHRPADGRLDPSHPDIIHDLSGAAPRSLPGLLAAALHRRRQSDAGGITLISCDNIPANGEILAEVVTSFAAEKYPELAGWIAENVRFPSTMVDRIVPATSPADLAFARKACEMEDRAAVVGEPFRQWVIEDRFLGARPRWDLAGAEFVRDVEPYELIKMRLLNGAQSAMSYLGALVGLDYSFEDARDPLIASFVRRMLESETAPGLPKGTSLDIPAYIARCFQRLRNPAIRHRNHQIATDGSQKIVQRILNPIRDCLARDAGCDHLAAVVAAWMAYLLAAAPRFGARWTASDPWAEAVRKIADEAGTDLPELVRRIMALGAIFGTDLAANEDLAHSIGRHLEGFLLGDPRRHLSALPGAAAA